MALSPIFSCSPFRSRSALLSATLQSRRLGRVDFATSSVILTGDALVRDLKKLWRRGQLERQEGRGLMNKTKALPVHHAFLYISFSSLYNYDVKWPNFKFTWERERQGDKFYHLCLNSGAVPSLRSSINFLLLSDRVNCDNPEKV